jgi:hypothetical protein
MPYQILTSTSETTLFRTGPLSAYTIHRLKKLFGDMDEKFPQDEGFTLTVERFPQFPRIIPREIFRTASISEDPKDMLKLFVPAEDFRQFQRQKQFQAPGQFTIMIDDLENYDHVEKVVWYLEGYFLFQRNNKASFRYLLPGYQDIESDDLEELEYELYLSFLQGGDC